MKEIMVVVVMMMMVFLLNKKWFESGTRMPCFNGNTIPPKNTGLALMVAGFTPPRVDWWVAPNN